MSILDRIRGAKQAADQHQQRTSEQQQQQEAVTAEQPYRHIPTHARQDALNAMPGTAVEETRQKIREQHQRRMALGLNSEANRSAFRRPPSQQGYFPPLSSSTSPYGFSEAGPSGTYMTPPRGSVSTTSQASVSTGILYDDRVNQGSTASRLSGQSATDFATDASGIVSATAQGPDLGRNHSYSSLNPNRPQPSGPPTESSVDTSYDGTDPSIPDTVKSSQTSMSSQAHHDPRPIPKQPKSPRDQELFNLLVGPQTDGD